MAVLPGPDDVGPFPDNLPRRQGVGGWSPQIISNETGAAGRGLEQLGTGLAYVDAQQQEKTNQLQMAQARGAAVAATTGALATLPTISDPAKLPTIQQNISDTVGDAVAKVADPYHRQLLQAELMPHMAEVNARIAEHGVNLDNQAQIAGFEQSANTTISNSAAIDDDALSARGLQTLNTNLQTLQDHGVITAVQRQQRAQQLAAAYVDSRHLYLYDQALRDPNHDTSRLERFVAANEMPGAPGQPGAGTPMDAPAQRIAGYAQPIRDAAQKYGVSPVFLSKTAYLESRGDPTADNGFAHGLMQFSDGTAAQYGVNAKDPASSIDGAAHYAADNAKVLTAALGRQPTDAELYLAHQQDGAGAAKLLTNPNTPAGQLVSPAAIRNNGGDPNAPASQFTSMWAKRFDAAPSFASAPSAFVGLPTARAGGAAAPPTASNAYFIGDSVADGLKSATPGALGRTQAGASPQAVQNSIASTDPKDLQGKTIYLSSGASNAYDPKAMAAVGSQIQTLVDKGVDPKNIRLLGVGDRADFTANNVNDQLAAIAARTGATFTGPLDPTNLRRSPADNSDNGVHFADWQKGLAQVAGTNAMNAPTGVDASTHPTVPDKSQWPANTAYVAPNNDGTLSYVDVDGNRTPVPGMRATGAPGAPLPARPSNTLLDSLPPQQHAEMLLKVREEIDSLQRLKTAQVNQQDRWTSQQIKDAQGQMVQGQPVPDPVWSSIRSQAMASPDPATRQQFAQADAARNTLTQLKGLSPAQVGAAVDDMQADYTRSANAAPFDPSTGMKGAALQAAKAFEKVYQTEVAKDPLGRAAKDGVLPNGVAPITPGDPSIVQSIQKRVADAQNVAAFYKQQPKYLLPQERLALRGISVAGGQPMVNLASSIVAGAGANAGPIFKEIGADAPAFASVGALALQGAPPETIDDIAKYTAASNDKDAKRDLPRFNEGLMRSLHVEDPLGDAATALGPDADGRLRATANILAGARAMREGRDPKIDASQFGQDYFDQAYNKALGATYDSDGNNYGGIANYGGGWFSGPAAQKTLVPLNMKAKDFGTVVGSLTDADLARMPSRPYKTSGTPMTAAEIRDGHIIAQPDKADGLFHGRYGVVMGDPTDAGARPVMDANGRPWVLDLQQMEPILRQRFPGSYLEKAPAPRDDRAARVAAQPYRGLPGMIPAGVAGTEEGPTIPQEE